MLECHARGARDEGAGGASRGSGTWAERAMMCVQKVLTILYAGGSIELGYTVGNHAIDESVSLFESLLGVRLVVGHGIPFK